jgi:hypothetical protein
MSFLSYPSPRYGGKTGLINASFRPADTQANLVSRSVEDGVTGASRDQRIPYLAISPSGAPARSGHEEPQYGR